MRKSLLAVAILLFVAIAVYFFFHPKNTAPTTIGSSAENSSANNAAIPAAGNSPGAPPVSAAASNSQPSDSPLPPGQNLAARAGQLFINTNPVADLPPATVLANVRRAVRQYGEMFGGDPVGTNPEITSQLLGKNPKHINFIDPSAGMRVNENGELVDAWGTPYFFHQLSGTEMEIHSAGPDKIMWTSDDIVVK